MPKPPPASSPFWRFFNGLAGANRVLYRLTGGRVGGKLPGYGSPIILVHHTGRKSGEVRVSPLIAIEDEGRWVIIASKGGTKSHPAWFHNLRANPETQIEVGRDQLPVRARVTAGSERERLWQRMAEVYPPYDDYAEYAGEREIPVISLDPR